MARFCPFTRMLWSVPGEAGRIASVVRLQPAASPRVMDRVSDHRLAARLYRRPELYGARIGLRMVHRAVRDRPLGPPVHVFHDPDFDALPLVLAHLDLEGLIRHTAGG